jgi:hypothetical protein
VRVVIRVFYSVKHYLTAFTMTLDSVAVASLVVALCAMVATVWQAAIARKHNRLSVRPVLTLYRREIDGVISVRNNGSGPAIVIAYELYSKEKGKRLLLNELDGFFQTPTDVPELTSGVAIAVGESVELVKAVTFLEASHQQPMRDLRFRIVYESIYGERRVLD